MNEQRIPAERVPKDATIEHVAVLGPSCGQTTPGTHQRGTTARVIWPDVAKGIGIILVVIGHSLGGMLAGGQIAPEDFLGRVFEGIYTFHMPLFFVLSGLFIPDRIAQDPTVFVRRSLVRIFYPYIIWGLIQIVVIVLLGRYVNKPLNLTPMLFIEILWTPPSQFWFLYCLFIMQILALIFYRFSNFTTMLLVALIARLVPDFVELPKIIDTVARFWLFHAGAVLFAIPLRDRALVRYVPAAALIALLPAWFAAVVLSVWGGGTLTVWNLPAAALGTYFVLWTSATCTPNWGLLTALGRRSMPIFLTHVLIVAGIRIFFVSALKITDPWLILAVATFAGLIIPCLVYDWADRRGFAGILALR